MYREAVEGRRVAVFLWGEVGVRVYDDADTAFNVIKLFGDDSLPVSVKGDLLPRMLFPDPAAVLAAVDDLGAFLDALLWELCGLDVTDSREHGQGKRVIDWEQDEDYLKASLLAAYGRTYEELRRELPLRELCAIVGLVPHDTPMGQALYYRTAKPPKATKYNEEERRMFRKRQALFALKDRGEAKDRYGQMSNAATSAFDALKKVSANG